MVEDLLHHVLGDVPVDQGGPERVPPLVRCQVNGPVVLVAHVAAFQPPVQGASVGAVADRDVPVGVGVLLGEQHCRAAGPAACQRLLLPGDFVFQLLVDGH